MFWIGDFFFLFPFLFFFLLVVRRWRFVFGERDPPPPLGLKAGIDGKWRGQSGKVTINVAPRRS